VNPKLVKWDVEVSTAHRLSCDLLKLLLRPGKETVRGNLGHYPSISLEGGWGWSGKRSHWIGPAYWPGFVNYNTIDHDDVICPPLQSAHACSAEL